MEETYDMPYKKSLFSSWLLNQSDGVFAEMQISSYNFIIRKPKAYSDQFTIAKDIDAESPIIILGGQSVHVLHDNPRGAYGYYNADHYDLKKKKQYLRFCVIWDICGW